MLTALVLMVVGAGLLLAGAEAFAEHIVPASRRLGVSAFGLALLVAGAEPEEAWTAAWASGRGQPDLAAGDAIGANLVIATLTLGLLALVAPFVVTAVVRRYAAMAAVTAGLAAVLLQVADLGRVVGVVLVVLYVGFVAAIWLRERRPPPIGEIAELGEDVLTETDEAGWVSIGLVIGGLLVMLAGGVVIVNGAERLITASGLGGTVVGVLVLGFATSVEMLALVAAAGRRGVAEIALAGVLGAITYNATVTLGLAALVSPLALSDPATVAGVSALVASVGLAVALAHRRRIGRLAGGVLLFAYVASAVWLVAT